MTDAINLLPVDLQQRAVTESLGDVYIIESFGDPKAEYDAARTAAAFTLRADRSLLSAAGDDRAPWLHNLVTNQVKTLSPGDGQYAFCLNIQGRILFDLHYWLRNDEIWIDLDSRWKETALTHLNKYIIMEDVALDDISGNWTPVTLLGPRITEFLAAAGIRNAANIAYQQIQAAQFQDIQCIIVRGQLGDIPSYRLFLPKNDAGQGIEQISNSTFVTPVGRSAIDALRIQAGYVWPVNEINDDVLPAETGQIKHAVSFQKGCYLGQEVVERMNARKVVARKLMQIEPQSSINVQLNGRPIFDGNQEIGRITSASTLPRNGMGLALGYIKSKHADHGKEIQIQCGDAFAQGILKSLPEFEDHPV
jgi:folate-binding protein YgfZ